MPAILKLNKGTAEKLVQWTELKPGQSMNLSGKELSIEVDNSDLVISPHKEGMKRWLEISDLNGSFGVWIELNRGNVDKLRGVLDF
jgi:hypothetical protein